MKYMHRGLPEQREELLVHLPPQATVVVVHHSLLAAAGNLAVLDDIFRGVAYYVCRCFPAFYAGVFKEQSEAFPILAGGPDYEPDIFL